MKARLSYAKLNMQELELVINWCFDITSNSFTFGPSFGSALGATTVFVFEAAPAQTRFVPADRSTDCYSGFLLLGHALGS